MKRFSMIVGANRNVGLAIAMRFAREGQNVVMTGRDAQDVQSAAGRVRAAYPVEVIARVFSQENADAVKPLFDSLENALVNRVVLNAAAPGVSCPAVEANAESWLDTVRVNLLGGFLVAREAAARLIAAGAPGSVLFVGSNTSRRAIPNRSDYIASKGGLQALTKALAVEWGEHGIRVNILMPGSIHTDRWDALDAETLRMRRQRAPLLRVAQCDEVASLAWFLSSDESANTTGAEFVTDAGADALLFRE